ncbi:MAG TPA: C4-dicarboxylate ABC transporter substrate-binding protein [Ramlibacter sp.]|uniref:C4-dicarboxylate ABC transporter substrate-binding protein n=1 Tax=Ramlibacter sp. TaxID=1917967 RepID=UPI002B84E5F6|nr:C4-dicarboxylate ABC transporter substrate-binding protein [Ramlibacter sp.]HVZ43761.1 C4-dicarboxylate ABC transporter substrate-binding protein [Ramlibacter sp.]
MSERMMRLASLLVLPLAVLLFAQWPLRDVVQWGSRQANDAAQVLFALYMACAVTAASRAGSHLAVSRASHPPGRIRAWILLACTAPWAAFVVWSSFPTVIQSVSQLEHFPETFNPGYFIVRLALWLLAVLVLLEGLAAPRRAPPHA